MSFIAGLAASACDNSSSSKSPRDSSPQTAKSEDKSERKDTETVKTSKSEKLTLTFESGTPRKLSEVKELAGKSTTMRDDLKEAFCIHAYKLPLKSDFNQELGLLCDSARKPLPLFLDLDRYSKVVGDKPQGIELEHSVDGDYSASTVAAIYEVPLAPKFVKEGHIPDYMAAPADFGYFKQESRIVGDLSASLGGDLQFGKHKLSYKSSNTAKDGKTYTNERATELNAYQTQGGETNIGTATEHLLGPNKDYQYFNTITVTIGTKSGGSALLTLIRVKVRHNGFPEDARRLAIDSATAQASHVREGVMDEMAFRINK